MNLDDLARSLHALEKTDNSDFRRRARVLQSIWREEKEIPCGTHKGSRGTRSLGSRLPMPSAKAKLDNFLTEGVRRVVRREVIESVDPEKLFGKPRIFNDLLSSQPLCFNLFAELEADLGTASAVVSELTGGRFTRVLAIDFEHSPGRGDPRYLDDRSAFDVFLTCDAASGGRGFIGIEVKYHEDLKGKPARHRPRYDVVAKQMGCFRSDGREVLRESPLQQIWRDHLLSGATLKDKEGGWADGLFVILYPRDNGHVSQAVADYRERLSDDRSFAAWTLEDFVGRLKAQSAAKWIRLFEDRYLAFGKIERRLAAGRPARGPSQRR